MPECYFPLRWESTGEQWWYASPIDWAAANGHYDLVRELLHLDTNLLIRLTSLRRIRRLETVWDDDVRFVDAAKCRSFVARSLLHECEMKNKNSLIRAGYGGWLLYTAASAGDMSFVRELLDREPLLVFGEGEYGVTDIFYAAARSKSSEVFRLLFDFAVSPRCSVGGGDGGELVKGSAGGVSAFRWEMLNRAVHAAARGGHLEFLKELLEDCSDVLAYRDMQGSTILHTASGRGQVEVVKDLLLSFDMIDSRDNQGNTALHVSSFRGHLSVVEALLMACPSSSSLINIAGDTFLHMAVAGFKTPGFRRLDRQMELMKQLISGNIVNIQGIINIRNNDGRTALHLAVVENVHTDLVELLMTVRSIDLNVQDINGMTPLDILREWPRSASSELLIKHLSSAGGFTDSKDCRVRSAIASNLKIQGIIGNSPGTSFRISDAEIFLCTGIIETSEVSGRLSSCSSASKSETSHLSVTDENHGFSPRKGQNSVSSAAKRLRILLWWPRRKEKITDTPMKFRDGDSLDSFNKLVNQEDTPTPLRQQFFKATSLANNKRILSVQSTIPSPAAKKKFTARLMHGVFQTMPHLASSACTPPGLLSTSPTTMDKQKGTLLENDSDGASCSSSMINYSTMDNITPRASIINTRMMNQYFCFGAQDLAVDDSGSGHQYNQASKRSLVSAI